MIVIPGSSITGEAQGNVIPLHYTKKVDEIRLCISAFIVDCSSSPLGLINSEFQVKLVITSQMRWIFSIYVSMIGLFWDLPIQCQCNDSDIEENADIWLKMGLFQRCISVHWNHCSTLWHKSCTSMPTEAPIVFKMERVNRIDFKLFQITM